MKRRACCLSASPCDDDKSEDEWQPRRVLGVGGFGKVQQVTWVNKNNKDVAVKSYGRDAVTYFYVELKALRALKHPLIIELYKSFQTPDGDQHLVLQYCAGGDLFTRLQFRKQPLRRQDALFYLVEVVAALHYLHRKHVLYADLKLENVLIAHDGHICLADFGSSVCNVRGWNVGVYGQRGSELYMAPEYHYQVCVGLAVDMWALGCLLYELFTSQPVCKYDPRVCDVPYVNLLGADMEDDVKDLLCYLLQEDPTLRYTTEQVQAHALFKGVDWSCVAAKAWMEPPWVPPADADDAFDSAFTSLPLLRYAC